MGDSLLDAGMGLISFGGHLPANASLRLLRMI